MLARGGIAEAAEVAELAEVFARRYCGCLRATARGENVGNAEVAYDCARRERLRLWN